MWNILALSHTHGKYCTRFVQEQWMNKPFGHYSNTAAYMNGEHVKIRESARNWLKCRKQKGGCCLAEGPIVCTLLSGRLDFTLCLFLSLSPTLSAALFSMLLLLIIFLRPLVRSVGRSVGTCVSCVCFSNGMLHFAQYVLKNEVVLSKVAKVSVGQYNVWHRNRALRCSHYIYADSHAHTKTHASY